MCEPEPQSALRPAHGYVDTDHNSGTHEQGDDGGTRVFRYPDCSMEATGQAEPAVLSAMTAMSTPYTAVS